MDDDLQICETFADFHPIRFNGHKTNLLCSVKVFGLLHPCLCLVLW